MWRCRDVVFFDGIYRSSDDLNWSKYLCVSFPKDHQVYMVLTALLTVVPNQTPVS